MAKIDGVQEISIDLLRPYENNAKIHGAEQVSQIAESIKEFGFISPCLIDRDYNIIAGHGRLMAAQKLGMDKIPCIFVEGLTETQRKAYILADNRLTELGEWDYNAISDELQDLKDRGFEIDLTGFSVDDILFEDIEDVWQETEEENEEEQEIVQPGEVWKLGAHRLMCGDSTKAEDVHRLMDGAVADLLETDPPYNVALGVGDSPEIAKIRRRRTDGLKIENDAMGDAEFIEFLKSALGNAVEVMRDGAAYYCWYASTSQKGFQTALEDVGLPPHQILIWVKNSLVLGRQDYQWRHEPCFYGWKDGAAHYFIDVRSLSTVQEYTESLNDLTKDELIEIISNIMDDTTTVTHVNKPSRSDLHPTMKPLSLIKKQIRNSSREGEVVLDLFGGSGTTLMACEEMRRKCYMMEYDPRYASKIVRRWEEETGLKAERIGE